MAEQTGLINLGSVTTQTPDTSFSGDIELVQNLQQTLPEYKGLNPYHLKRKLLTDHSFFNKVTGQLFEASSNEDEMRLAEENPEAFADVFATFSKNVRTKLAKNVYAGQTAKESVVNRTLQFRRSIDDLPLETYKNLIRENMGNYQGFNLIRGQEFIYDEGEDGNKAFGQHILETPALLHKLETDNYRRFEKELAKSHNNPALLSDITTLANAYTIYNNFSSEGLTQYMNYLQFDEQRDSDIASRFQQRKDAESFLTTQTAKGKTAEQLAQEFILGSQVKDVPFANIINDSISDGISPSIIASLLQKESNFNPTAVGTSGDAGIAQFMPATAIEMGLKVPQELVDLDRRRVELQGQGDWTQAREIREQIRQLTLQYRNRPEEDERFDVEKSINAASRLLSKNLKAFDNDIQKALAAYNAGAGTVRKAVRNGGDNWMQELPVDSTRSYIPDILLGAEVFGQPVMVHEPLTPRQDLTVDMPKDINEFTINFYKPTKDGAVDLDYYQVSKKLLEELSNGQYGRLDSETAMKFIDYNRLQDSEWGREHGQLAWSVMSAANSGELGFTTQDLIDTVLANSLSMEDEDGVQSYLIAYNDLVPHARLAVQALQKDINVGRSFQRTNADGMIKFTPDLREQNVVNTRNLINNIYITRKVTRRDEQGNYNVEEELADGILATPYNAVATVGMSAMAGLVKYFFEPSVRATANVMGGDAGIEFSDRLRSYTDLGLGEVVSKDTHGAIPMVAANAMEFVNYIGAAIAGGGGLVRGGASAMGALTGAKTYADVVRMSQTLGGSSRWAAISARLNEAVGRNASWAMGGRLASGASAPAPWLTGGATIYAGAAAIEGTQPAERSFVQLVPQLFGFEQTNPVREMYVNSSTAGRVVADIGASLMLDSLFDTVIRGGIYGTAKIAERMGRTEFRSIKYLHNEGRYDVSSSPEFGHDLRVFFKNLFGDLDAMPIGEIGRVTADKYNYKTLSQFTKVFIDNTSEVASHMRKDIEDNIRRLNQDLGDGRLPDSEITRMADEQYDMFLDVTAGRFVETLRDAGEYLPLKFAESLRNNAPIIREFTVAGEPITPSQLHTYRAQGFNIIEKDGVFFEVEPNFWTIDLAQRITDKALAPETSTVVSRLQREAGLPESGAMTDAQAQRAMEIEQDVQRMMGARVRVGEVDGYVVNIEPDGYLIRTADGDVVVPNISSEFDLVGAGLQRLERMSESNQRIREGFSKLSEAEANARTNAGVKVEPQTVAQVIPVQENIFQSPFVRGLSEARQNASMADITLRPQTVDDLMGRNVRYGEYEGVLRRDAENNIVVDDGSTIVEIPNLMKRGSFSIDEVGLQPRLQLDAGFESVVLDGNVLSFKRGLESFNFQDGEIVSASMRKTNGKLTDITDPDIVNELYNARVAGIMRGGETPLENVARLRSQTESVALRNEYDRLLREYANEAHRFAKHEPRIPYC